MADLSRRQFLHLSGVTLLAAHLPSLSGLLAPLAPSRLAVGRALDALPVFARGRPVATLWPDSVIRILDIRPDEYRVDGGWVSSAGVQPMTIPLSGLPFPEPPFWAEVVGPVAAVRRAASAEAPLMTRLGHGAVARVVHILPGSFGAPAWLALEGLAETGLGWTQAAYWQPFHPDESTASVSRLVLDRADQTLDAYQNGDPLLRVVISTSDTTLPSGCYPLAARALSGSAIVQSRRFQAVPHPLNFDRLGALVGVYWHNRFGTPQPGPAIQVPPLVARWLNASLSDDACLEIQ